MVLAIYQIILHLNKITECLKITTFKIVFTFDVFLVLKPQCTAKWHVFYIRNHFTDNKSCQIIESILQYKNGFKNNLMYKEIFNYPFFENSNRHMNEGFSLLPPLFQNFHINHSFFKIFIIIRFFFIWQYQ
jgi:hypothetical protein